MNEKAMKVVEAARSQLGNPYVYGAWGSVCTPSMRKKYARLNPEHEENIRKNCPVLKGSKSVCKGCKWEGCLAFDCRGFTHWCLQQAGITISGAGATSQYNTAGNWAQRGQLADMPDVVCCVFKQSGSTMMHTGMHIGGGRIIHCSAGVQEGRTSDKGWTHFAIPAGLYSEDELAAAGITTSLPTLKKGSKGESVEQMQRALHEMGYHVGSRDGVFGAKTEAALRAFQTDHGLPVDAICGPTTWAAILQAQEGYPNEQEPSPPPGDAEPTPDMAALMAAVDTGLEQLRAAVEAVLAYAKKG